MNATVAAIVRSLPGEDPPTLLFDEADTLWGTKRAAEGNEDLRGLLNAGWQRGRPLLRCDGPNLAPTEFPTFAMAALAGIGRLPDTITDRAIEVVMKRRGPGEKVAPYRQRRDAPALHALRDDLHEWLRGHLAELEAAEPVMPPGVEDRAADAFARYLPDPAAEHEPTPLSPPVTTSQSQVNAVTGPPVTTLPTVTAVTWESDAVTAGDGGSAAPTCPNCTWELDSAGHELACLSPGAV